jgi:hypothetical protein
VKRGSQLGRCSQLQLFSDSLFPPRRPQ